MAEKGPCGLVTAFRTGKQWRTAIPFWHYVWSLVFSKWDLNVTDASVYMQTTKSAERKLILTNLMDQSLETE